MPSATDCAVPTKTSRNALTSTPASPPGWPASRCHDPTRGYTASGVDVWGSCEAAYEDPACFARALLGAISAGRGASGPGRRTARGSRDVVDALVRLAPLEVCLLLDDVHEIPPGSPGAALLREV